MVDAEEFQLYDIGTTESESVSSGVLTWQCPRACSLYSTRQTLAKTPLLCTVKRRLLSLARPTVVIPTKSATTKQHPSGSKIILTAILTAIAMHMEDALA